MMREKSELAFSEAEYDRRLDAARAAAERSEVQAMLYFDPASICYLSGFSTINLWDLVCLIVTSNTEPVTVFRQFEMERFRASSRFGEHIAYPHDGACWPSIAEALRHLGCQTAGIEVSRYVDSRAASTLAGLVPNLRVSDCSAVLNEVRLVKSQEEIAILRKVAKVTDCGVLAGKAAARNGATDYEICAETTRALIAGGSDFMCIQPVIAAGPRTGIAHSSTAGVEARDGDPIFFEVGACIQRYTAPLMRTMTVGRPPAAVSELADLSSKTLEAMIASIRPDVSACEVASVGHNVLAPALHRIAFHFVWGYSVGLGFPPSWLEETGFLLNAQNDRKLQPGMIFHLPLMLRVPGQYGAGFSETVLVTNDGAEVLSSLPRQL